WAIVPGLPLLVAFSSSEPDNLLSLGKAHDEPTRGPPGCQLPVALPVIPNPSGPRRETPSHSVNLPTCAITLMSEGWNGSPCHDESTSRACRCADWVTFRSPGRPPGWFG